MQRSRSRSVRDILVAELIGGAVWEFVSGSTDDGDVVPVDIIPVTSLAGRIAAVRVRLANGQTFPSLLGNVDLDDSRLSRQFLTLSLHLGDVGWFHLARYHDADFGRRGPAALAEALRLSVSDVFPITYDLTSLAVGEPDSVRGEILSEPLERLSREELIALAVPRAAL